MGHRATRSIRSTCCPRKKAPRSGRGGRHEGPVMPKEIGQARPLPAGQRRGHDSAPRRERRSACRPDLIRDPFDSTYYRLRPVSDAGRSLDTDGLRKWRPSAHRARERRRPEACCPGAHAVKWTSHRRHLLHGDEFSETPTPALPGGGVEVLVVERSASGKITPGQDGEGLIRSRRSFYFDGGGRMAA